MNKAKKIISTISVIVVIACVIGTLILTATAIAGGIERNNYIEEKRTEFHSRAKEEWGKCLFVDEVPEDAYSVKYGGYDAVIEENMVVLAELPEAVNHHKYKFVSLEDASIEDISNMKQLLLEYRVYSPECKYTMSYVIEQHGNIIPDE